MGIKYVTTNLINSTTLDKASSEDVSGFYDKENIYNKIQSLPLRFTAKTSQYVIVDLGSDTLITFAGVFNHNLTTDPPGAFTLKAFLQATGKPSDCSGGGDWSDEFTVTAGHKNSFLTFSKTYRYWALCISDAGNANNPEIGEFVLSNHASFTKNFVYPYREILVYLRGETITPYGQRWLNQKAKVKRFLLDFLGVTDANLLSEIQAFFEAIDGDDPFVFIPDDAAAYSWFVNCLSDLEAERAWLNYNNFSLELVEQARGITLL